MNPSTKIHRFAIFIAIALGGTAFGGVTYTCDPSINADAYAKLCATLNGTAGTAFTGGLAGFYSSMFTNANATIYISFNTAAGLGESTVGHLNLVPYSVYQSALQSESTDAAKAFVPATEPSIYGGGQVELTSALANALGITSTNGNPPGDVLGTEFDGTDSSSGFAGAACINPGNGAVVVASASACYNGIITLDTPAGLDSSIGQGYTYRGLGGSTTGTTSNYDIFSVIEHETDEILGTASCYDTDNHTSVADNCNGTNIGAVDNFRYSANGTRTLTTVGGTAYFSPDGGATDLDGNAYDNQLNGDDWADFSNSCTFVQDGVGCPDGQAFDITTDGPGGTPGPEVAILNAVGFNLTPEPGTLGLLGASLIALALGRKRLSRK
jgi:hypothetical protein